MNIEKLCKFIDDETKKVFDKIKSDYDVTYKDIPTKMFYEGSFSNGLSPEIYFNDQIKYQEAKEIASMYSDLVKSDFNKLLHRNPDLVDGNINCQLVTWPGNPENPNCSLLIKIYGTTADKLAKDKAKRDKLINKYKYTFRDKDFKLHDLALNYLSSEDEGDLITYKNYINTYYNKQDAADAIAMYVIPETFDGDLFDDDLKDKLAIAGLGNSKFNVFENADFDWDIFDKVSFGAINDWNKLSGEN